MSRSFVSFVVKAFTTAFLAFTVAATRPHAQAPDVSSLLRQIRAADKDLLAV